jgi:hypothetical protein
VSSSRSRLPNDERSGIWMTALSFRTKVVIQDFNSPKILRWLTIKQTSMSDDSDRGIRIFNDRYAIVVE